MPSFRFTEVRHVLGEFDIVHPLTGPDTITPADVGGDPSSQIGLANLVEAFIQQTIDLEDNLDDLPVEDPEHRDNFNNFKQVETFFENLYPAGNVTVEVRQPGNQWWRVTRNEVVSVTWDAVNSVYNVKVSTVG